MTFSTDLAPPLLQDSQSVTLTLKRTSPTTATLSWTPPPTPKAYDGIVVVISPTEINPSNYPTDGQKYTASTNMQAPADRLGSAPVVVALYGDVTTVSTDVTGLDPSAIYYGAGFPVTNVRTYFTPGVRSYQEEAHDKAHSGDIPRSFGPPTSPFLGQVYFDETTKLVYVWDGLAWKTTLANNVLSGSFDPVPGVTTGLPDGYPAFGDFFYNFTIRSLKVWNGNAWLDTLTPYGEPTYGKPGVGTTGRGNARANIISVLKQQMGYPVVCVELTDAQFQIALNNALQELRRRTDSAYYKQYYFMQCQPDQDVYYLNEPTLGTNKIVDVLRVHRLNLLGLVNFAPDNIYAQQFLNQFFAPGVQYDLVSIHLVHSMSEMYSQLFAGEVAYNWREATRELRFYRRFATHEKVILETTCEKPEEELLVDRWLQQWIQQWAEAELFMMLANIRGKYATLPGPGGGLTLNASECRAEGQRLQEDCVQQVNDMLVGQQGPDGWHMPFVIG